jgi:uncharacterized protein YkwD
MLASRRGGRDEALPQFPPTKGVAGWRFLASGRGPRAAVRPRRNSGVGTLHLRIISRRNRRIVRLALAAVAMTVAFSATEATSLAQAPVQYRTARRPAYNTYTQPAQPRYYQQPTYQAAAQPAAGYTYAQPAQAQTGDPSGFLAWLNGTRARHGLGAVGYDQSLANDAAVNNQHQNSRGLGHYYMGRARRQNSAMGSGASIGTMWMNSPGHRAALLDPSIRAIGLAGSGSYWTFNAY